MGPMKSPESASISNHRREFGNSPAENLRRAWQTGHGPDLDAFAGKIPDLSPAELAELIRVDFDIRWQHSDPRRPEDYFRRFAAVAANAELAVDVIYAEYLAREQAGQRPNLTEYQERFPAFAGVLSEQIQLHEALDALGGEPRTPPSGPTSIGEDQVKSSSGLSNEDAAYEIIGQIGCGGMGVVYKARQTALDRFVALKMVRAIDVGNPELLVRFRSEARVVAALHHQHIVQVYDYGEHEGLPYIAMEFIAGGSLADRLDGTPWPPRAAAVLLIKLAGAVQFAHERQVVHRDLKPANVLITSDADELDVKITDFGLAKLLAEDSSSHTKSYAFLGTPSYMAPEQAGGRIHDIGPAADIYALGAILYELLAGQPPLRGESPIETLRMLLSSEPLSIQRLAPHISRDLATICDKCLQSEPSKRYGSGAELAADLARYLEERPIHARPIGKLDRAWRWCRRNPTLAGAMSAVAVLLFGIAAVSVWYSGQLGRELANTQFAEKAERQASQTARQLLFNVYLSEASVRNNSRQVGQRFAAMETVGKATALLEQVGRTSAREAQLRDAVLASVALPDLRQIRSLGKWRASTHACAFSIAADLYVVSSEDGTLNGYRLADNQRLWTLATSQRQSTPFLSPDGQFIAAVTPLGAKVWRIQGTQPQPAWEAAHLKSFLFLPDGQAVYTTSKEMRLVRAGDGLTVRTIGLGSALSNFSYHAPTRRLAVCGSESVQVIALDTGEVEAELRVEHFPAQLLAWHPSGQHLAIWSDGSGITLWNVQTGLQVLEFPHFGMSSQLCFNTDGTLLLSQSLWNQRLCVWEVGSGRSVLDVPDFFSVASEAGPERQIYILSSKNAEMVLSELVVGACRSMARALDVPLGYWNHVSISPEGRIASFSGEQGFELWDLESTRRLLAREIGYCMTDFDREGRLIVACQSGAYRLSRHVKSKPAANVNSAIASQPGRRTVVRYGSAKKLTGPLVPVSLATSAKSDRLVFEDGQGWALMYVNDSIVQRLETERDPRKSAVDNDGRFAAIANWNGGGARVWDAQSGRQLADLPIGRCGVLQFSPDGRFLAATPDGVTLWNTSDWQRTCQLGAHGTTPTGLAIAFSPDSRVLAVGQTNGMLGLYDPLTGNQCANLPLGAWGASAMTFSPDQRWLVTSSIDERAPTEVWDLTTMRRELFDRGLDLPSDVLEPNAISQSFEEQLEIIFDDDRLMGMRPLSETEGSPILTEETE